MAFKKVGKSEEIPAGSMKKFVIDREEILVINLNNTFYGLAARCTHARAPLELGLIVGDTLECPWHDARFKISDGSILMGPPKKPLKTYPCVNEGQDVLVDM